MQEAYRSNAEGEEEKYQEALSQYQKRVRHAQGLSWVYVQRRARRLAGLLASLLALFAYPVVFVSLLYWLSSAPNPSAQLSWWPHGASLVLALLPLALYVVVYRLMLRKAPTRLLTIFEVPRRVASTPESTLYLQQQDPLQKLRDECARLAPGSLSWSTAALIFFSTQLPILLLLLLGAVFTRFHAVVPGHCWLDGVAGGFFVGCFTFFGFYPFMISSWASARYIDDKDFSTLSLSVDMDDLNPSFAFVIIISSITSLFMAGQMNESFLTPMLRACVLVGALLTPILFAVILGVKLAPWRLQRLHTAFEAEHAALYPSS